MVVRVRLLNKSRMRACFLIVGQVLVHLMLIFKRVILKMRPKMISVIKWEVYVVINY